MHRCPHCSVEIRIRELPHQGFFDSYRICPGCGGKFTVDQDTRYRQGIFIGIALISLAFTLLLYFQGDEWLFPALGSYAALAALIYWGNRRVFFVPYDPTPDDEP